MSNATSFRALEARFPLLPRELPAQVRFKDRKVAHEYLAVRQKDLLDLLDHLGGTPFGREVFPGVTLSAPTHSGMFVVKHGNVQHVFNNLTGALAYLLAVFY